MNAAFQRSAANSSSTDAGMTDSHCPIAGPPRNRSAPRLSVPHLFDTHARFIRRRMDTLPVTAQRNAIANSGFRNSIRAVLENVLDTHDSNVPVRIRDIAERLGVSEVTVSLALHNHPRISEARRQQVRDMADKMGYRPNAMAAALAHRKWSSVQTPIHAAIAWLNFWQTPDTMRAWQEFDLYWQGASSEAERCGYRLDEFNCDPRLPCSRLEQILLTRNIRGILIPPAPRGQLPDWGTFKWSNFSAVRFGYSMQHPRVHVVSSDQLTDGLIAFDGIWDHGYRRVGLVTSAHTRTRFSAGYLLGQMRHSVSRLMPPLVLNEDDDAGSRTRLAAWMKREKPDAILTDMPILRGMLQGLGIRVPQHVGLATTSVLDGCADAGIYQNSKEIGRVAVQLLISLLHHNETGIPEICREVLIEGRWVDGKTLPLRKPRRTNARE